MKKLLFVCTLLFSNAAFALLPPHHQQAKEIAQILAAQELHELTQGEPINTIHRNGLIYTLVTDSYEIEVHVVPEMQKCLGPMQFHLEFTEIRLRT